jgi:hypothetical protein
MKQAATIFIFVLFILSFYKCSFEGNNVVMSEYKLRDGSVIQLVHYNNGATAPMGIQIKKKNSDIIIDDLDGFAETYTANFNQINDTLLKITLRDTAFFKGKQIDIMVNLKNRINK